MKKKLLFLIAFLIVYSLGSGAAILGARTEEGEPNQNAESILKPESYGLYRYVDNIKSGIVLNLEKAEGYKKWEDKDSFEEIDGLKWTLVSDAGDDEGSSHVFMLQKVDGGTLRLRYMGVFGDERSDENAVNVFLEPYIEHEKGEDKTKGDESEGVDSEITEGEDTAGEGVDGEDVDRESMDGEDERSSEIEFLYVNIRGMPEKATGRIDYPDKPGLRARIEGADKSITSLVFVVPEDYLIKYTEYLEAEDEYSKWSDQIDDQEPSLEAGAEKDNVFSAFIDGILTGNELKDYESKRNAQIVLNVTFDSKEKAWSINEGVRPKVVSADSVVLETGNRAWALAGLILLGLVSLFSMVMNWLLVLKKTVR